MQKDPVIDDIRAVRHEISEEFGHDSDRLIDHLIEREKELIKTGEYKFLSSNPPLIVKRIQSSSKSLAICI